MRLRCLYSGADAVDGRRERKGKSVGFGAKTLFSFFSFFFFFTSETASGRTWGRHRHGYPCMTSLRTLSNLGACTFFPGMQVPTHLHSME